MDVVADGFAVAFDSVTESFRYSVAAGRTSPLEYHMHKARMDVPMLAQTTGFWQWRIRRHFRPAVFAGLPDKVLARYAEVMGLEIAQLKKAE